MERLNKLLPFVCALVLFSACKNKVGDENKSTQNYAPTLDEISASWVSADTVTMEPSIRNFRGQALLNKDMTSISWFVSAPYSGEYHSGALKINGVVPKAKKFRWQPYQALRKGKLNQFDIESTTRMLVDGDAIMWQVKITNTDSVRQNVDVDLDLIGFISKFGGHWNWWYPQPNLSGKRDETRRQEIEDLRNHIVNNDSTEQTTTDRNWPTDEEILNSNNYRSNIDRNAIYIHDKKTPAITAFSIVTAPDSLAARNSGGKASWEFDLAAGETKTIKYLMAYGDDMWTLKENVNLWTKNFDRTFAGTKAGWEEKWKQLFTPHNKLVSGCFPVLETDDEVAKRVYYTGPLTLLYLLNTNLPQHARVYLSGGPKWGGDHNLLLGYFNLVQALGSGRSSNDERTTEGLDKNKPQ